MVLHTIRALFFPLVAVLLSHFYIISGFGESFAIWNLIVVLALAEYFIALYITEYSAEVLCWEINEKSI